MLCKLSSVYKASQIIVLQSNNFPGLWSTIWTTKEIAVTNLAEVSRSFGSNKIHADLRQPRFRFYEVLLHDWYLGASGSSGEGDQGVQPGDGSKRGEDGENEDDRDDRVQDWDYHLEKAEAMRKEELGWR